VRQLAPLALSSRQDGSAGGHLRLPSPLATVRHAVPVVLEAVVGPLALFCAATEQSEHFARKYIGLSVGLLFSQVMVVLGMKVAQVDATLGAGIAGTFMALVVLLLLRRLPALVSSAASGAGGGVTRVIQTVILRRFTGAFR